MRWLRQAWSCPRRATRPPQAAAPTCMHLVSVTHGDEDIVVIISNVCLSKSPSFLEMDTAIPKEEMTGCLDLLQNHMGGSRLGEEAHREDETHRASPTADADEGDTVAPVPPRSGPQTRDGHAVGQGGGQNLQA